MRSRGRIDLGKSVGPTAAMSDAVVPVVSRRRLVQLAREGPVVPVVWVRRLVQLAPGSLLTAQAKASLIWLGH